MSDLEKQVDQQEQVKDAVNANAVPGEPTKLKNDAEDLGAPVVKPTDSNPDATKKTKKVSDQVNKDANDGSLPNDQKPSSMKKEEVEDSEEVSEMAKMNAMKKPMNAMAMNSMKKMNAMKKMEADDADSEKDKKEMMMKDKMKKDEMAKMKKESTDEVEIDLSDDVKALVSSDADLSEEFKDKAATIFETAVKTRIKEQVKILEAQYEEKLSAEKETVKEAMVEKVDSYLNYVVEEWMKENELAVERGIRTEIAEDFITGLKDLFKQHYIDVPEEKYNVLDDLTNQNKQLEDKLNEQIEKNVELSKKVSDADRATIVAEISDDLADTEKEKFTSMAENVEYDSADKFREKLETIKESYFPKKKIEESSSKDDVDSVAANAPATEGNTDAMAAYTAAITKNIKSVKV
tara:strand:+ start:1276 stop:2493 length:1218 start_codon:yes stop_codon:yes gene_type:complete